MDSDRPDLQTIHRGLQQFPARPLILTPIETDFGTSKNMVRVMRGDGQSPNLDFPGLRVEGQVYPASLPPFPTVWAVPDASADGS